MRLIYPFPLWYCFLRLILHEDVFVDFGHSYFPETPSCSDCFSARFPESEPLSSVFSSLVSNSFLRSKKKVVLAWFLSSQSHSCSSCLHFVKVSRSNWTHSAHSWDFICQISTTWKRILPQNWRKDWRVSMPCQLMLSYS